MQCYECDEYVVSNEDSTNTLLSSAALGVERPTSLISRGLCWLFYRSKLNQSLLLNLYMCSVKCSHWSSISTYLSRRELCSLFWVAGCLPRESIVIEFGSCRGASSLVLAAAVARRGGVVYCVDTWQNDTMPEGPMDTMPDFLRNTKTFANSIRVLRQRTTETQLHQLSRPASLAFIDADHSYDAVRADVQTALQLMNGDAGLLFHDMNSHSGVSRVVGELLASGKWQLHQLVNSLGWLRPATGMTK